jgi:hypothetical protein
LIAGAAAAIALAAVPLAGAAPATERVAPATKRTAPATERVAPGVEWVRTTTTAPDGGPLRLNVLTVDRAALRGRLTVALPSAGMPARERTSVMARRDHALAAINGSVFAVAAPAQGDPIGALVAGGQLVSEPLEGRAALLVPRAPDQPASVRSLRFRGSASTGGRSRMIDGVDRLRGVVPGCGGRGGDRPTERPNATLVCTDPSELVVYTRAFATRTRASEDGVEVSVRDGRASAPHRGGGAAIPADGLVLSGSGDAARFLVALHAGDAVSVDVGLLADGQPIDPGDYAAVLSGGPRLLAGGAVRIPAAAEGYRPPNDPGWAAAIAARNPRTMAGVAADGKLILATADGRQGGSVGLSYREAAEIMRRLGARDAVNLDGGGSATMVVGGTVVNQPSDAVGERPVASSLQVVP